MWIVWVFARSEHGFPHTMMFVWALLALLYRLSNIASEDIGVPPV